MILPILTMLQTLPPTAPEPGSAVSVLPRPCAAGPGEDGDVVVCARPRDADRLAPLPPPPGGSDRPFDPLLLRLPGGASARLHAFQHTLLGGATSQGAAVTLTVPLGRRKRD